MGNVALGLSEMRRVTRGHVAILTCDPAEVRNFWLNEYAPEVLDAEARRYPQLSTILAHVGGQVDVRQVPIPLLCRDGFNEAYYGRPELLLDEGARLACSAWSFVDSSVVARFVAALRSDLDSGVWDARFGSLRSEKTFAGSLRLVVAREN